MISEKEILEVFNVNRESGLYLLHQRYANLCFSVAFRYLQNHEDAEEKVSDTFISAFNKLHNFKFEKEGLLRQWIKRVCINHCLMFIRQKNRISWSEFSNIDVACHETPHDILDYNDLISLLLKLPDAQRFVFQLYEIDGFSHPEISEKLGMSVGTSKSYLHRAKTALKEYISQGNYCHE